MSATLEMPYFIKPSISLTSAEKELAYAAAREQILATIGDEGDELMKMVTINSLLKTHLPYFYWIGFYLDRGDQVLTVGPYQGTLGCLYIKFGRGVCGSVALSRVPKIVSDCHALVEGSEHIACDPNSRSEIVLPVVRPDGSLLGVLDIDSTELGSFDEVDLAHLQALISRVFS